MNSLYRWITLSSLAAALVLIAAGAFAFTDSNAEQKEVAADRAARIVLVAKAVPPKPVAWLPPATAKQLDGFKPVLPAERSVAASRPQPQTLAKAESR